MTVKEFISAIKYQYCSNRNDQNAVMMTAYMKNKFPFIGIKAPLRQELFRIFWPKDKTFIKEHFRDIVNELWTLPEREYQMMALLILSKCRNLLRPADLSFVENLITTKSWWDTVDFLATNCIGHILLNEENLTELAVKRYINSRNMWLFRTALIFQLKYGQKTNKKRLFGVIKSSFGSTDFFINKASGWALRQYSKHDKETVKTFLSLHKNYLSKLTIREASKYL